jgi:type I restriction enzyme S subunit
MSFPRYSEYKDSGVAWLGEVPRHWEIRRIRQLFEIKKRIAGKLGFDVFSITQQGIKVKDVESNEGQLSSDYSKYQIVEVGDFAMNHMDLLTGGVDIAKSEGVTSPDYRVVSIRNTLDCYDRYFLYVFQTCYRRKVFYAFGQGSSQLGRWRFPTDQFNDFYFPLPPKFEQEQIANFLDNEIARIDELVTEQQRLIELLQEKRQAVISHAVTKGLNPDAPMKPSGVEWLGEVPAHWEIKSIKWLSPVKRGASPRPIDDPKYFDEEGEYAWVRIADVSASDGILRETTQRLSELGSSLSMKISPGDLFISIAGTVGKPCISAIKACIHDGFVYFPTLTINPLFLYRIFEAGFCYGGLGKWGTQLNLNTDTIGSIRIALPPLKEIEEILIFLDKEMGIMDALIREAQHAIDLLQERRQALISAAVTGHIDVREFVSVSTN